VKAFRDLPIKRKLTLLIIFTSSVALLLACAAFLLFESVTFRPSVLRRMTGLADIVGAYSTTAITLHDPAAAQEALSALQARPDVLEAVIWLNDGTALARYGRGPADGATLPERPPPPGHEFRRGELVLFREILHDGREIGTVGLRVDLVEQRMRLRGYALIMAAVLLGAPVVGWALSALLQRLISEPVLELARVARAVSERHEYSVRAQKKSGDEVGALVDAFNEMLGEIERARQELEARVEQRTMELRTAEAKYRSLVEQLPAITYVAEFGPQGRWLYVSPQIRQLLGFSPEEWMSHPELWFRQIHPDDRETVLREETRSRQSGEPLRCEYRMLARDGRLVWFRDEANVVRGPDGEPLFLQGIMLDVTARKQAEEQLRQTAAALERSNRELEMFASVVSHDLQEPLRAVSGCVQILQQRYAGNLDEQAGRLMHHVVEGAARMRALINDLLAYSRLDSRAAPAEPTDATGALQRALENLEVAIRESGAVITHDPMPVVTAEPTQLMQLFQNLIGNAIKYRAERTPEIHIGARRTGGEWLFWVRDNGIGIEPQYFERIFGIFQRLHTRAEYSGTGIGLAVCKKIVERHGGRIWVESEPGKGSTFYFTLPATS
jgi:PAS domain S-box-containing protein